jgi:hypothetical protein
MNLYLWTNGSETSMSSIALIVMAPLALLFGVTVVLGVTQIPAIRRMAKDFRGMMKGDASG